MSTLHSAGALRRTLHEPGGFATVMELVPERTRCSASSAAWCRDQMVADVARIARATRRNATPGTLRVPRRLRPERDPLPETAA